ncbi:MAG: hypothetical protein QOE80_8 [Actinomycetota bacterium]|nr:hypothetical protein [Actinomycetota bacterium]
MDVGDVRLERFHEALAAGERCLKARALWRVVPPATEPELPEIGRPRG